MITIPASRYSREEIVEALGGYDVVVAQLERGGNTGFEHFQTWVEHTAPIRFSTLQKRMPGCHLVARKAPKRKAYEYVTKKDTRVEGVDRIVIGDPEKLLESRQGERTDVQKVREAILEDGMSVEEVLLEVPQAGRFVGYVRELVSARDRKAGKSKQRDVRVTYLFGPPGSGKTSWVYETFDDVCRVTSYEHPFDAYTGEDVLVLDEFNGQLSLELMNNLLDRYPLMLPARYYDRVAKFSQVVIVSNHAPWDVYKGHKDVTRQAFARRLHRVIWMEERGAEEVNLDSVRSRFGLVNAATPAAALEGVPDVVDGDLVPAAAADALELEGEQPPF